MSSTSSKNPSAIENLFAGFSPRGCEIRCLKSINSPFLIFFRVFSSTCSVLGTHGIAPIGRLIRRFPAPTGSSRRLADDPDETDWSSSSTSLSSIASTSGNSSTGSVGCGRPLPRPLVAPLPRALVAPVPLVGARPRVLVGVFPAAPRPRVDLRVVS